MSYSCTTCIETGDQVYKAYCVFTKDVRSWAVGRLFPYCSCLPITGRLSADPLYASIRDSLINIGIEPSQGQRIDLAHPVASAEIEPEHIQGLSHEADLTHSVASAEIEPEHIQGLSHEAPDVEKDQLKKEKGELQAQLDASNREREELKKENGELQAQVDKMLTDIYEKSVSLFVTDVLKVTFYSKRNLRGMLEKVYEKNPPLCERHTLRIVMGIDVCPLSNKIIETNSSLTKAFKAARMHYHPDKNQHGDLWCKVYCSQISRFLNEISHLCEFDGEVWQGSCPINSLPF
jgi:hypothetical protein